MSEQAKIKNGKIYLSRMIELSRGYGIYNEVEMNKLNDRLDRMLSVSMNIDILIGKKAISEQEKERLTDMVLSSDTENLTMAELITRQKLDAIDLTKYDT